MPRSCCVATAMRARPHLCARGVARRGCVQACKRGLTSIHAPGEAIVCMDMRGERTDSGLSLVECRTLDASVVQPASRTRPTHAGNRRGTWIDRRCLNLYCHAQRVHNACVYPCAYARACACTCVRLRVQARVHVCRACALRLRVQARVHVCGSDVGHRCTVGRGRSVARAVIVAVCVLHADRVKWPRKRQRLRQRAPH